MDESDSRIVVQAGPIVGARAQREVTRRRGRRAPKRGVSAKLPQSKVPWRRKTHGVVQRQAAAERLGVEPLFVRGYTASGS